MANEKAGGAVVTLRDRFMIYHGTSLPDLSSPSALAFAAEDRKERDRPVFAMIVKPGYPARIPWLRLTKGADNPGLMQLLEWGVVDWPPAGRKVMAMVYARPMGGRLWDGKTANVARMDEASVIAKIITPIASALKLIQSGGQTHRSIRPDNMFWVGPDRDRVVLGDAGAGPPAYDQPAGLEPVESALSLPAGRGDGNIANDMYCFGASLAVILQGRDVTSNFPEETVIRHKMAQGSYSALASEARLPLGLVEVLRGTLCDDPQERWDTEALDLWLNGRRLTPMVPRIEKKAIRAFVLSGKEYMSARELAIGIHQTWEAAMPQIGEGKLEIWLRRAVDNKGKADAVANALSADPTVVDKRVATDVTLARICMILDGSAPIRYKTLSSMIDGFRWLLPMTVASGGDVKLVAEALTREVPKVWFQARESYNPDDSVLESGFRTQKAYLDRAAIGWGLERVVYEMNESAFCLSPILADDYVVELRDLLPAMNAYAKKKGDAASNTPVDRHIAAFIAARANFDVERLVGDLSGSDAGRTITAAINLLAMIQWRVGQGGMGAITLWLGNLAKPSIASFHNREKRKYLEVELPKVAKEGSILELSRMLDSADERGADIRGFEEAKMAYNEAWKQVRDIEEGREDLVAKATQTGQQIASLISVTIAFITFSLLLIGMMF